MTNAFDWRKLLEGDTSKKEIKEQPKADYGFELPDFMHRGKKKYPKDLTGLVFSRLTVECSVERINDRMMYRCLCECGNKVTVRDSNLKDGRTQSCGCLNIESYMNRPNRMTIGQFMAKAKEVHGDRYDYSLVKYINRDFNIQVVCREHGVFWQLPRVHLSGSGCPVCSHYARSVVN